MDRPVGGGRAREPLAIVDADFEVVQVWSHGSQVDFDFFIFGFEAKRCLVDGKVGIDSGVCGEVALVPLGALTEFVFDDKHFRIVEAGIHEVGVWDVADKSIFIQFIGLEFQFAEAIE